MASRARSEWNTQMQLSFGKGLVAGAAGVAVVLVLTAAANGTGIGAVFNLGQTNKVNATSTLTGKAHGAMLAVTNSGHGPALNLHVSGGHAPFSVNSATKVAHLNASLLGGISPTGFVRGGGHVVSAEVELTAGQANVLLFNLPGYGKFEVSCFSGPTVAEVDYTAPGHGVNLFDQSIQGTGGGTSWQFMPKASGLGLQTQLDNPEQDQWTIQPAGSHHVTGQVATVQTDEAVNNDDTSKCDFAAVGYAMP
jgi:hypothetical protein